MNIIVVLLIGLISGSLFQEKIPGRPFSKLDDILAGVLGSLLGTTLYDLQAVEEPSVFVYILAGIAGAMLFLS